MLHQSQAASLISWTMTALVISGCALLPSRPSDNVDYRKRAAELARELKRKNALIDDLKEKNQVLSARATRDKSSNENQPIQPEISTNLPAWSDARELPKKLASKPVATEAVAVSVPTEKSEHLLYAKVVSSYGRRDLSELQKALKIFLKTFPESAYADNAIYLSAMLAVQKEDFRLAHRALDHLLKEHAEGNKAVSALFTKGALFKKEKKWASARRAFQDVAKTYPGSPESLRVPLELRLIAHLEKAGVQ